MEELSHKVLVVADCYENYNDILQFVGESLVTPFAVKFINTSEPAFRVRENFEIALKDFPEVKVIVLCTAKLFKAIARVPTATGYAGTAISYDNLNLFYMPSVKEAITNPQAEEVCRYVLHNVDNLIKGTYVPPGTNILQSFVQPKTEIEIQKELFNLKSIPKLAVDIETYSLTHTTAKLASIAFGLDTHKAVAFSVDYGNNPIVSENIKRILRDFFTSYRGTLIFHNCLFDVCVLTYELYMDDKRDYEGMYLGLENLLRDFEDTKLISYFCLNSCARPDLSLKTLSREYTGKYALEEIGDLTNANVSEDELLKYNAIDTLATQYIYNKYYPQLYEDSKQFATYQGLYKQSVFQLLIMQLVGMSIDPDRVKEVSNILNDELEDIKTKINSNPIVMDFVQQLRKKEVEKKNALYKKKRITEEDVNISFNPGSNVQLSELLFDTLGLTPTGVTKKGSASTDNNSLAKMQESCSNDSVKNLLQLIIDYSAVSKIINTFIPVLTKDEDKVYGYFNLGSVVSGRLSASDSLQQMPSTGTKYAKLIKSCFKAPEGWLMVGIDYASLEDYISALLTKDSNKLKVYMPITVYKVEVDGNTYYLSDDDEIVIDGVSYKPSSLCRD